MGQYYHPIIVTKNEALEFNPHIYNESAKITEHSNFSTPMIGLVMQYLYDRRKDNPRLVWQGDYGEPLNVGFGKDNVQVRYHSYPEDVPDLKEVGTYRYIINLDKKEYVDLVKCREMCEFHPLPLLTANGNGRGGGDYLGSDMDLVGSWAGDRIAVANDEGMIKTDYLRLEPQFKEE